MFHFSFYLRHALQDMTANKRRTAFALFCVAAGVAAIVALRTLALSIGDTLVNNIAGNMHGDMVLDEPRFSDSQFRVQSSAVNDSLFSGYAVEQIKAWAAKNHVEYTDALSNTGGLTITPQNGTIVGRPQFVTSYLVDTSVYPLYSPITAVDPSGTPFAQLFTGGNDVVISKALADNDGIKVGDQVHVSRTTQLFTVRGIIPTETGGLDIAQLFFGAAYFDKRSAATLQFDSQPNLIYLRIPPGANVDQLAADLRKNVGNVGLIRTTTLELQNNKQLADIIDRLIVSMGLIALLIGGVGIIHTMLVVVRRRTVEIAVLKTIGVKGTQIAILFLIESIVMGIVGSLLGDLLGIALSGAVLSFSQRIWVATLQWKIYPEALLTGFEFGVVVTAIFGVLPTLVASRVRPAVVLRPNESIPPASGCLQTLAALLAVVFGVGLIAGNLLGNVTLGIIGVLVTLIILGLLIGLMYVLVLILTHLPAFGNVDLKLALRGIGGHRFRTASTLLALSAGMFALSSLVLASISVPILLNVGFENVLGGNVLVFSPIGFLNPVIDTVLNTQPGVDHYGLIALHTGQLLAINGDQNWVNRLAPDIKLNASSLGGPPGFKGSFDSDTFTRLSQGTLSGQDVTAKGYNGGTAVQGRPLNAADAGKPVMVLRQTAFTDALGLKPGDKLTYQFGRNQTLTFTVVGIISSADNTSALDVGSVLGVGSAPMDSFDGVGASFTFTVAQVNAINLNGVLVALSSVPGVFAIDVGFIDSLFQRLLEQFTTIPTVVAVLSLFAAAVIIANTVSLATLERRREIGVMKAIGLKGWRTLGIMTIENGIIGFVGGFIGIGISVLGVAIVSSLTQVSIIKTVSWGSVLLLLVISVLIAVIATWISAWTTMRDKPLNVLRYE